MHTAAQHTSNPAPVILLVLLWLFIAGVAIMWYWTPSLIAAHRKVPDLRMIVLLNLFLGWFLPVWAIIFYLAVRPIQAPPAGVPPPPPEWHTRARGY